MNKNDLIRAVSQETDQMISQNKIAVILGKAVEIIGRTLESGESVKWKGFGSLVPKEIPPRRYYSPGEKGFTISKGMKKIVFAESSNRWKRKKD